MNSSLVRKLVWTVLVAGAVLLATSCVTTGHWEPEPMEKGSAKGGASLLMQRR